MLARRATWLASLALLAACAQVPEVVVIEKPAEAPPEVPAEPESPTPPEVPPEPPRPNITIASVGDMMIGTDFPENHLPDDDGIGFFGGVQSYLSNADLAVGNLEGVLVDGGEPAKACKNPKACWLFRSPTRYASHYRAAGFDVLSLANNHARDFGEEGRTSSMEALDAVGIVHSGREGEFASFEAKGLKVAFLAFAVTRNSNLMLDYDLSEQQVHEHARDHDIVIVSFHGGAEGLESQNIPFDEETYYGEPRGDVVLFARRMVDAGADLVIGHGPHVIRAMERYKDRLIAYSLGNFATYYGISVAGIKGVAPILVTKLGPDGRFIDGSIVSTRQLRPAGPTLDPTRRALRLVRELTAEDFGDSGLSFNDDGTITAVERGPVPEHPPVESVVGGDGLEVDAE
ncbi:MAG: CapA family protein [Woeseiaceae bacterium]|nr:CapA family protein [Woeseiaceae bacterium]